MKEANPMDQMDAITLLYLLKTDYRPASLLDCAHQFQQTKSEIEAALQNELGDKQANAFASGKSV